MRPSIAIVIVSSLLNACSGQATTPTASNASSGASAHGRVAPTPSLYARAKEWLLRRQNPDVRSGNEHYAAEHFAEAVLSYNEAARSLPNEAGVHLNRGLGLARQNDIEHAVAALELAQDPRAPRALRRDAYFDLGVIQLQKGDAQREGVAPAPAADADPNTPTPAAEPNLEEAVKAFEEAVESFKHALRMVPGDEDAGWNLEVAIRRRDEAKRAREQQQQQQQQQQEQQQNQNQNGDSSDGSNQSDSGQDQNQEPNEGDSSSSDPQNGNGQNGSQQQGQNGQPNPEQNENGNGSGENGQRDPANPGNAEHPGQDGQRNPSNPSQAQPNAANQSPGQQGNEDAMDQPSENSLTPEQQREMRRVLESLEQGEQSFERARARGRAGSQDRRPRQDW